MNADFSPEVHMTDVPYDPNEFSPFALREKGLGMRVKTLAYRLR